MGKRKPNLSVKIPATAFPPVIVLSPLYIGAASRTNASPRMKRICIRELVNEFSSPILPASSK